ncbi:AMP-binding protein (plasmid) [Streptomyces sp. NBC_00335]|uniref:AMP-binding protein n=1 Tax=unclassified Streptomyces TaxID=2593676 RepID=UPI0022562855|nr:MULTISPECIES: AMP-binding protein [unclassified Streptomyces]MCX5410038.1 AMP-binding protein [Streptomyces sp. NBC_00086]
MTTPDSGAPAAYVTSAIEQFAARGGSTALIHGERSMTFAELLSLAYRTARVLRDAGLGRGDRLVLLAANPIEMSAVGLAAHLLGISYTPVYAAGGEQVAEHILRDAAPAAVILACAGPILPGPRMAELARAAGVKLLFGLGPGADPEVTDLLAEAALRSDAPLAVEAREEDVARVLYTGGTTGLPKGVVYTFGALTAAAGAWAGAAPPPGLRFLAMTPMAHAAGAIACGLLRHHVSVELFDEFDADVLLVRIAEASAEGRPVTTYLYPPYLYRLLDHPALADTDLSGLAAVSYGSAPVTPHRLAQAVRGLGPRLRQSYALTEAIAITSLGPEDHAAAAASRPELFGSVGRAVPGVSLRVTGGDGRALGPRTEGAVEVSGPTVMAGYWQRPGLSAEVLRDGWLSTGDLGVIDEDGYLYLTGRAKDLVIVDGTNCYPQAVENVLTAHPDIRRAAVIGVPDPLTGEALVAVCVSREDPREDGRPGLAEELRASVREALGAAHAPGRFEFVPDIPTASYGKPDKAALRALFSPLTPPNPTSPTSSGSNG